jgi:hypothetical protein
MPPFPNVLAGAPAPPLIHDPVVLAPVPDDTDDDVVDSGTIHEQMYQYIQNFNLVIHYLVEAVNALDKRTPTDRMNYLLHLSQLVGLVNENPFLQDFIPMLEEIAQIPYEEWETLNSKFCDFTLKLQGLESRMKGKRIIPKLILFAGGASWTAKDIREEREEAERAAHRHGGRHGGGGGIPESGGGGDGRRRERGTTRGLGGSRKDSNGTRISGDTWSIVHAAAMEGLWEYGPETLREELLKEHPQSVVDAVLSEPEFAEVLQDHGEAGGAEASGDSRFVVGTVDYSAFGSGGGGGGGGGGGSIIGPYEQALNDAVDLVQSAGNTASKTP